MALMLREDEAIRILDQLEQVASKLGVTVRYEYLGDEESGLSPKSGSCCLRGYQLIIVDKHQSRAEQCRILVSELKRFDLSKIFVSPIVRKLLEE
jgi:hypothetical protein